MLFDDLIKTSAYYKVLHLPHFNNHIISTNTMLHSGNVDLNRRFWRCLEHGPRDREANTVLQQSPLWKFGWGRLQVSREQKRKTYPHLEEYKG